jgi:hypothetical protein
MGECLLPSFLTMLLAQSDQPMGALLAVWLLLRLHFGWAESHTSFPLDFLSSSVPVTFGDVLTVQDVKWFLYQYSRHIPQDVQHRIRKVGGIFFSCFVLASFGLSHFGL